MFSKVFTKQTLIAVLAIIVPIFVAFLYLFKTGYIGNSNNASEEYLAKERVAIDTNATELASPGQAGEHNSEVEIPKNVNKELHTDNPSDNPSDDMQLSQNVAALQVATTEDPHTGMTAEELKQHLAIEERKEALRIRMSEYSANVSAFAETQLKSSRRHRRLILSAFKNLSTEQLEQARKEALKTLPEEDVEEFFNDLAEHRDIKTLEQMSDEANAILMSDEAAKIVRHQLQSEADAIKQAYNDLYGDGAFEQGQQEVAARYESNN